jgi:long-chain acyl-CoA synthetase
VRVSPRAVAQRHYDGCVREHLATLVEDFRKHSGEIAVVAHRGNRSYRTTYGELAQLAGRFAAELDRREIAPGERVVLWGANSAAWIAAFFGCLLRGVIVVPLDAAGSVEFAARVVRDVRPRLIVGDPGLLGAFNVDEIPLLSLGQLNDLLPLEPSFAVSPAVNASSALQIVFTSGTTSEPKGIVHTHANVLASTLPIEREMQKYLKYERLVHPLRFLHTVPLSHVFGQFMGLWLPALLVGEVHFAEQLEARRVTEIIRRERISVLVAVPRVLELLRAHLLARFPDLQAEIEASEKLSVYKRWWRFRRVHSALGWKFWAAIAGGAALPASLEAFWNRIGIALIQGYGMTETTALVTLNHPFKIACGTIGKALPGREVRIGEDGEILVRGAMLSSTIWKDGQTHQRQEEWLATGDLAAREASGELRYLGRKGDLIVAASGMNIHPADLEAAMKRQPPIRDCVVVPYAAALGAEPAAVVLTAATEAQMQEALRDANRALAAHQQIRRVLRWPDAQFPYTATGKLLRRVIAAWVAGAVEAKTGASESTAVGADVILLLLSDMVAEITHERPAIIGRDLSLNEDFHLDSLGRVQLQTAIEQRFGVELEDDALTGVETLGQLRGLVEPDGQGTTAGEPHSYAAADSPVVSREANTSQTLEHIYPRWPWSWPVAALRIAFIELVMRPLVWLLGAPRVVRNGSQLPAGPLVIIANHVTMYDGALILYALPGRLRRQVAIAMAGEMLLDYRRARGQDNALLNVMAPAAYLLITALFNIFPLPRRQGFQRSFSHAGQAMDRGYSLMIFPEGTRSLDGEIHPFRQGIGLLASQSQVPILPVALIGLGELAHLSAGGKARWFRSGRLEIRVGEAILPDSAMAPAEMTAKLEAALRELYSAGTVD